MKRILTALLVLFLTFTTTAQIKEIEHNLKFDNEKELVYDCQVLIENQLYSYALLFAEKLVLMDSNNHSYQYRLGFCLGSLGKHEEAIPHLLYAVQAWGDCDVFSYKCKLAPRECAEILAQSYMAIGNAVNASMWLDYVNIYTK